MAAVIIPFPAPGTRESRRAWRDRCAAFEAARAASLSLRDGTPPPRPVLRVVR